MTAQEHEEFSVSIYIWIAEFKDGSKVLELTNEARLQKDNNKAPGTGASLSMHHMQLEADGCANQFWNNEWPGGFKMGG